MDPEPNAAPWLRLTLALAGLYNLVRGTAVVLLPRWTYDIGGQATPVQPLVNVPLWQCIGMIVGVYGVGYLAASQNPVRHWPVVLVGFLGKVLGPMGFLQAALAGEMPWRAGITNIFNDVIWWVPFALMLRAAWRGRRR